MRLSIGLLLLSLSVFAAEVGPNQTIGNEIGRAHV